MEEKGIKLKITDALTLLSALIGFISIVNSFQKNFLIASCLIIIAAILDGLDGKISRMLNMSGEMGKELDSLADIVSFGVAPAALIYNYRLFELNWYGIIISALLIIAGCTRLARFNLLNIKDYFLGLSIPTAAFFILSFVISGININATMTAILVLIASFLMISKIKYPNFKEKFFKKENVIYFAFILISSSLISFFYGWRLFLFSTVVLFIISAPVFRIKFEKK